LARELLDAILFPALWVLQQPRKHSHSLQLANHTQLAHHYIQWALTTLRFQEDFFKVPHSHIKAPLGYKPHQSDTPSLFIPVAAMGKCKQI